MKPILRTVFFSFIFSLSFSLMAQKGIYNHDLKGCDSVIQAFMNQWGIPSVSMAISKDEKVIYDRAFGFWDLNGQDSTNPEMMYRIASVSKPVTVMAIRKLIEAGKFSKDDKVFGPSGVLSVHPSSHKFQYTDPRIDSITVDHLINHRGGWDRDSSCFPNPTSPYPWWFGGCEPFVAPLHVTEDIGSTNPIKAEDYVVFMLKKGLDFSPGARYTYSNVGYGVLGEIVRAHAGVSYESYLKDSIMIPNGIYDMHLGESFMQDRRIREVQYEGNGGGNYAYDNSGVIVPWEYGGYNVRSLGSFGGWIASPKDYLKLFALVDGFGNVPDILSPGNSFGGSFYNYGHSGALDGTRTVIYKRTDGYSWTIFMNKRIIGAMKQTFDSTIWRLGIDCINTISNVPAYDLMDEPKYNASNLSASMIQGDSITLSWQNGDGNKRLVIGRFEGPLEAYPLDGKSYTARIRFENGDTLGDNTYAVYDGLQNQTVIKRLNKRGKYHFQVIEYNESTNTGNYKLYLQGDVETIVVNTCHDTVVENKTACQSFRWNKSKINYQSSGTYYHLKKTESGCDTVYRLNLNVNQNCASSVMNLRARFISDSTANLYWDTVANAVSYRIFVRKNTSSAWDIVGTRSLNIGLYKLSGLTPNTTYLWTVRVRNANGTWSNPTALERFKTLSQACERPTNYGTSGISSHSARLTWTDYQHALYYLIRYRVAGAGSWTTLKLSNGREKRWLTGLIAGTSYEWQMKSVCSFTDRSGTQWSAKQTFTTLGANSRIKSIVNENNEDRELFIYPNPSEGLFFIELKEWDANTQLQVYNQLGEKVFQSRMDEKVAEIDLNGQANGIYFIRIIDNKKTTTHRLIKK